MLFFLTLAILIVAVTIINDGYSIQIIIVLVWVLLGGIGNEYIKNRLYRFLSIYPTRNNNYINLERNYDIAFLGGTEAVYAVQCENNLNLKLIHWASENQSLSYSYLIIKNAFSLLKENGYVVLCVTPYSFFGKEEDDRNRIRYDFFLDRFLLWFHDPKHFDLRDFVFLNIIKRGQRDSVFLRTFSRYPVLYPIKAIKLLLELTERERLLKEERVCVKRLSLVITHIPDVASPIDKNCVKNKEILLEICRFLVSRNLQPIIMILPVSKDVSVSYPVGFLENCIMDITKSDMHIPILNYLDRKEFEHDDLYLDGYRLNTKGRHLFTDILLHDIDAVNNKSS
jgi:hypothetical protein